MDTYTPFTYLLRFKPTGQLYYGAKYAKGCHPDILWTTYFSSSDEIERLRNEYGDDSFECEVRKIFKTADEAIRWENKFLKKVKARDNPRFLNGSQGFPIKRREWTADDKVIQSSNTKSKWADPEFRTKQSEARKKLWQDPAYRARMVEKRKHQANTDEGIALRRKNGLKTGPTRKGSRIPARSLESRNAQSETMRRKYKSGEYDHIKESVAKSASKRVWTQDMRDKLSESSYRREELKRSSRSAT